MLKDHYQNMYPESEFHIYPDLKDPNAGYLFWNFDPYPHFFIDPVLNFKPGI